MALHSNKSKEDLSSSWSRGERVGEKTDPIGPSDIVTWFLLRVEWEDFGRFGAIVWRINGRRGNMESGRPDGGYCSKWGWRGDGLDHYGGNGGFEKWRNSECILRRVELMRILFEMSIRFKEVTKIVSKKANPNIGAYLWSSVCFIWHIFNSS